MKVIVSKFLNVRVGKPRLNAPCYQYLAPGSELEVDGEIYKGDLFDGIDSWLKDGAGNYYWVGGVDHPIATQKLGEITNPRINGKITFNWFNQLKIQDVWSKFNEQGDRARVVVLDTGYDITNQDIKGGVKGENVLITNDQYPGIPLVIKDQSNDFHGSRCSGLVGARNGRDWILGVAPACELQVGKISIDKEILDFNYIMEGIKWAIAQNADVISISYAYEELTQLEIEARARELELLVQGKNVLIFAAAGNSGQPQRTANLYPASFDQCVSIGASTATNRVSDITVLSSKTILHAPGEHIEAYGKQGRPSPQSGTSFSTPIIAGVAALAISHLKKKNGTNIIDKNRLLKLMSSTGDLVNGSNTKRIINPLKLFNNL